MPALLLPGLLALALLAALPVIIHLLTRQRVVRRTFPALAFLLQADAGRSQRRRWREWLLLLLRCLALLLAALAAAGLVWRGSLVGSADRPAVILIDASASMRQVDAGASSWSRARSAGDRLLGSLRGRPVSLVISGSDQRVPEPSVDHGLLRASLAEAEPGHGDGGMVASLAAALEVLPQGGDLMLITDLARGSLAGVDPASLPAGVELQLVDAGGGGDNCAITQLSIEPAVAVAGRPVRIIARVANYGSQPRTLGVNLRIGRESHLVDLRLEAGRSGLVQHEIVLDSTGSVPVRAELVQRDGGGDALALDNHRDGALTVVPALRALIASDADVDDPGGLVRPLRAACAAGGLQPQVVDGAGLAELGSPDTPAIVISGDLRQATKAMQEGLRQHLRAGGAWVQIIASDADVTLGELGIDAPMALGERIDVSAQERGHMQVAQARLDATLLEPFVSRESLLTQVAAYRYRLTPQGQAADATVLWAYADGSLAFVERPVGEGRWLTLNCSPALADSNLAAGEVLPLLIARLPQALLPQRQTRLARPVGDRLVAKEQVIGPDGTALPQREGQVHLLKPGLYRVAGGQLHAAAVPALESDLRQFDPATLGLQSRTSGDALSQVRETPLWSWVLVALALVLAAEMLLAGGLGRSTRATASEAPA